MLILGNYPQSCLKVPFLEVVAENQLKIYLEVKNQLKLFSAKPCLKVPFLEVVAENKLKTFLDANKCNLPVCKLSHSDIDKVT